jgi:hypothetical protein
MTTAQPHTGPASRTTTPVGPAVLGALSATTAVGLVAVVLAAFLAGTPAVLGAAIAVAMVLVFFGFGAFVVGAAAALAPAASLLVALLTYTLKVLLIGLVFLGLTRSGALEHTVDAGWLGGTVIAGTITWMTSQIVFSTRARQPVYDLPSGEEEASVR